jgi:DNA-binding MarR family transcriptional regulator
LRHAAERGRPRRELHGASFQNRGGRVRRTGDLIIDLAPQPHPDDGTAPAAGRGLAYWHVYGKRERPFDGAALAVMASLPGFSEAAKRAVHHALQQQKQFPLMSRAFKDLRRLIYGYLVLYLHAQGGVTTSRLQQLSTDASLASAGRAKAILLHMRMLGLIRIAPDQPNKRERLYQPTPELEEAFRAAMAGEVAGLCLIEPEAAPAVARLQEPEFFRQFVLMQGRIAMAGVTGGGKSATSFFAERDAGISILYEILASAAEDDAYPPKGPLKMSLKELSRRQNVSRSHVFRLLTDAETRGYLTRDADTQTGRLSEILRLSLVDMHAAMFMSFASSCQYALLETAGNGATIVSSSQ